MNVRKPIDYSAMYANLDILMVEKLPQMELYFEIGKLVSASLEKGAAVAAAEYLSGAYSGVSGFSPRNLRRMREFYRTYENCWPRPRLSAGLRILSFWKTAQLPRNVLGISPLSAIFIGPKLNSWRKS